MIDDNHNEDDDKMMVRMVMIVIIWIMVIGNDRRSFSIFGNFGKVRVSVFHLGRFAKVESIFGQNEVAPGIDMGGNQHISASFGTVRSILGSPVWP